MLDVWAWPPIVLAHGGGLPGAALIGGPLLIVTIFLVLELRANKREQDPPEDEG